MKREVAAKQTFAGNFRRVCPITNRATATAENGADPVFFIGSVETPGSVRRVRKCGGCRRGLSLP